jgi:glutathione S-transferase
MDNPNGKVPTLVNGQRISWESDAVICQLSGDTRAGGALYFEHTVRKRFGLGAPDRAVVEAEIGDVRRFAKALDDHFAGRKWIEGGRV